MKFFMVIIMTMEMTIMIFHDGNVDATNDAMIMTIYHGDNVYVDETQYNGDDCEGVKDDDLFSLIMGSIYDYVPISKLLLDDDPT